MQHSISNSDLRIVIRVQMCLHLHIYTLFILYGYFFLGVPGYNYGLFYCVKNYFAVLEAASRRLVMGGEVCGEGEEEGQWWSVESLPEPEPEPDPDMEADAERDPALELPPPTWRVEEGGALLPYIETSGKGCEKYLSCIIIV